MNGGVNVDAIPLGFRSERRWIVWKHEVVGGKPRKTPYRIDFARPASSTDPDDWTTVDEALSAVDWGVADGIGYALPDERIYTLVDLDDCVNGDGTLHPEATRVIERLGSFAEWSQSRQGLHVLVRGRLNGSRRQTTETPWGGEFAVWDRGRFVYVTGWLIDDAWTSVEEERQVELDMVVAEFLPPREPPVEAREPRPVDLDDRELIEKALRAKNGAKFARLWEGDTSGYESVSEADAALVTLLAFWTDRDPARIDSLFRASGLMRWKWKRVDYRERTIAAAITRASDTYKPRVEGAGKAGRMARATPSTEPTKQTKEALNEGLIRFFRAKDRFVRPLGEAAFEGRAGRVVAALAPNTEASPVALLVSLLTMFGSAVGSRPHVQVGADRHRANLFSALVGPSGTGRKGMAMSHAEQVVALTGHGWADRVVRGLVSGEGVIWHVRDPRIEIDEEGNEQIVEEGAKDKRLLVREDEFASVLAAMSRDGSTLSGVLRDAWDGRRLQTLAKHSPAVATGAHVSILAAITPDEVLRKLTATEQANGFANRFLWVYVERSQELPEGAPVDDALVRDLGSELGDAADKARRVDGVLRDDDAKEVWRDVYSRLTRDVPGMTGAMRSRAEAQTLRLSLCYALLDGDRLIRRQHVAAALELWEYAERSLFRIFGDTLGDPTADRILAALRAAPAAGLTRTEINELFARNVAAQEIERALGLLARAELAFPTNEDTGGRPVERWHAGTGENGGGT